MTEEGKPCQCRFDSGTQIKECDFHKRQRILERQRLNTLMKYNINIVFKDTHLYEIKDELLERFK